MTQKTAPKAPEWPSYGNFFKVTLNPDFLKKCKWWTKGNFSKIAKKVASLKKPKKTLRQMVLASNLYALKLQILDKI